jgi:hypothetical protein
MTTLRGTRLPIISGLAFVFLAAGHAHAQLPAFPTIPVNPDTVPDNNADWFRPFVGYQWTYDNNLFRLPSASVRSEPAVVDLIPPGISIEDHVNTGSAGFDGHWLAGRQSVDYDFEWDDNRFVRNENLNNTSGNVRAVWNWSIASDLSGQLGGVYTRSLSGFADSFFFERDVIDRQEYFANGRYQIGPRWAIYGSIDDTYTKNEAYAERFNDLSLQTGKVGLELATSQQNTLGAEYRYAHGHYTNLCQVTGNPASSAAANCANVPAGAVAELNGVPYNPNYDENTVSVLFKYALTDKTALSGDAGYLRRNYPDNYGTNIHIGAFSGDIWHLKGQWQATEKTSLSVTASRDLQAYLYAQSDYFVQTGVAVSPAWVQSDKLTWVLVASWYKQDYIGASYSEVVLLGAPRHDSISAQQAGLQYTAMRSLIFNFTYRHELRNSNQVLFGYGDDIANAGVKFKF